MDAVGPFRYRRALVAGFDIALDPVAEFVLAGNGNAMQDRAGHFGDEDLDPVEPRGVVGVKINSKRPGLVARKWQVSRERLSSGIQISTPTA
jgi:hypothetical protein